MRGGKLIGPVGDDDQQSRDGRLDEAETELQACRVRPLKVIEKQDGDGAGPCPESKKTHD